MATVTLPTERIRDWKSFHAVCKESFGFPSFSGANYHAWVDCLTCLDEPGDVMTRFNLGPDETLHIVIPNSADLERRLPGFLQDLEGCVADVNERYEGRKTPALALDLV